MFTSNEIWAIDRAMDSPNIHPSEIRVFSDILKKMELVNEKEERYRDNKAVVE